MYPDTDTKESSVTLKRTQTGHQVHKIKAAGETDFDRSTRATVPETFYFPTWTVSERWTNDERTQSERCGNAERNVVNDVWTVNGERTQNANGAQTRELSERWTQDERSIRKASCVFFWTKYLIIPR